METTKSSNKREGLRVRAESALERIQIQTLRRNRHRRELLRWSMLALVILLHSSTVAFTSSSEKANTEYHVSSQFSETFWKQFSYEFTLELRDYTIQTSEEFKIPPTLALAMIWTESRGTSGTVNENIRPNTGEVLSTDHGFMQLNSLSFSEIVYRKIPNSDLYRRFEPRTNPKDNIYLGLAHLASLYNQFRDWPKAIMAYNCGSSAVIRNRVPKSTIQYLNYVVTFAMKW